MKFAAGVTAPCTAALAAKLPDRSSDQPVTPGKGRWIPAVRVVAEPGILLASAKGLGIFIS